MEKEKIDSMVNEMKDMLTEVGYDAKSNNSDLNKLKAIHDFLTDSKILT